MRLGRLRDSAPICLSAHCAGCCLAVSLTQLPTTAWGVELQGGPEIGYQAGATLYEFDYSERDPYWGAAIQGRSRLAWPTSFWVVGARLSMLSVSASPRLGVSLRSATNLADPSDKMVDEDWIGSRDLRVRLTEVGSTESRATLTHVMLDIAIWVFVSGDWQPGEEVYPPSVALGLGYRHEYYYFEGFDVYGWYGAGEYHQDVILEDDAPVIVYKTNHEMPYLALRVPFKSREEAFGLIAEGRIAPVRTSDFDDHLLRNKHARGAGWGIAVSGSLLPRVRIAGDASSTRFHVGMRLEAALLQTLDADYEQRFYGDDPGFEGDETGLRLEVPAYFVRSTRLSGLLTADLEF